MEDQQTGMGRYAEKIMNELDMRGVACIYEPREQLVRTCSISRYGELWGVYRYRHPQISSEVSFSLAVPACRTDEVEGYLASANGPIEGGRFYMDHSTGNIVFSSVYDIPGTSAGPDTDSFTAFCHLACDMFSRHHQALYGLVHR